MGELYHYTSVQSFESIIQNQCIRMTRSDFMNDPHDCKAFLHIVEQHIKEKMKHVDVENELFKVKDEQKRHPKEVKELIQKYPLDEYLQYVHDKIALYVFSMTDSKDSLPMWNYYGNNGICLEFKEDTFVKSMAEHLCRNEYDFMAFTKVEYIELDEKVAKLPLETLKEISLYTCLPGKETSHYTSSLHEERSSGNVDLNISKL